LELLERAGSQRERLRALESVRAALKLELKDHARSRAAVRAPTDEQLGQLEDNLTAAWAAFEAVKDHGHDLADRALAGVRSALDALRTATARRVDDPAGLTFSDAEGFPITKMTVSAAAFYDLHRIPSRYRESFYRVVVHMALRGPAEVEVFDGSDDLVWERRQPDPDVDPRLLPDDPDHGHNGNGNGEDYPT
jgi:hypothetical protein